MLWSIFYLQDKEVKEGEEKKAGDGEEGDWENEELEDEEEFGDDDYAQVFEHFSMFLNSSLISAFKVSYFDIFSILLSTSFMLNHLEYTIYLIEYGPHYSSLTHDNET